MKELQAEHVKLYAVTDRSWLGVYSGSTGGGIPGGEAPRWSSCVEKGMDHETLRWEALGDPGGAGGTASPS